jgi:hypothetical protein
MSDTKVIPAAQKFLSLDALETVDDVKFDVIDIPEWGAPLRVASLSAEDLIVFTETNDGPAKRTAGLRLIIKSVVDENGKRTGDEKKHLPALQKRNATICNKVVERILILNGMDPNQAKNTQAAEERKNA